VSRLEDRTLLTTMLWTNASGGDWDVATNWVNSANPSDQHVPSSSDDAQIHLSGVTVTHTSSTSDTVNSLTTASGTSLVLTSGSLALSTTSSVAGSVTLQGATLSTAGTLTVSGSMSWVGGTITGFGALTIAGGATLSMGNHANETLDGVELKNAGTVSLAPLTTLQGLVLLHGAGVDNQAGGSFNFLSDATIFGDGSATYFTNEGGLSAGSNDSIGPAFTQTATGSVTIEAGVLGLNAVGTQAGTFTGAAGTLLAIGLGAWALGPNSSVNTAGSVRLYDQATVAGAYDVAMTTDLRSGATVTFTAPIAGLGSDLDVEGGSTLHLPGQSFSLATLEKNGTIDGGGGASLTVSGTMTWVGGTVSGSGALNIPSGATLNLGNSGNSAETLDGVALQNAGTAAWSAGTFVVMNGGSVDNMPAAIFGSPGNTGALNLNNGTLAGAGTINANVTSGGQVIPGGAGAAGILTINGNYTQTATGALDIELGGTTAGSQYGQLAVSGTASLGGSLDVALISGFHPVVGNGFEVMTSGSFSGNFATYNGLSLGSGLFLDPILNATSLTLDTDQVAISGAPAFPLQGIPINLTGSVTGPSAGNFPPTGLSWTVTQNGNPFGSGAGSTFSFTPNVNATYLVSLTLTDAAGARGMTVLQLIVAPSIFVMNPSASGALNVSGNASINVPGEIVVDSSSASALSAAGNAQITASAIDVQGGFQKTGNATISPAPATGVSVADPLGTLGTPSTIGLTSYDYGSFTTGTHTICPGIYSQIKVSGNASLTLSAGSGGSPGIYIIEGGGLTVTGGASLGGQNVFIYNTGSNYPGPGGDFGGITLSGNGTFNLSAPTSGTYAGIVIFQSCANTRALSFTGNAVSGISGIIYAPSALLSFSGNSQLQAALDVGMLNLSGNVTLTQTAAGTDGTGDTSGIANTLLAGDLNVYINDPSGLFTADELARIQDAINTWDTLLAPYNVTITEVTDPPLANTVIDIGTSSACGGMANGVLGCFNAPNSEITLIQGWNWYAGSDSTQIGSGQYDFETTVLHELGHALGLGGATNSSSPMYEILASGLADRTVTVADLNIPDPPAGADPQTAAGVNVVPAAVTSARNDIAPAPAAPLGSITIGLTPLTAVQAGVSPLSAMGSGQSAVVGGWAMPQAGVASALVIQAADWGDELASRPWIGSEVVDFLSPLDGTQRSTEPAVDPSGGSERPVRASGVYGADQPLDPSDIAPSHRAVDSVLEELASESRAGDETRGRWTWGGNVGDWTALWEEDAQAPSAEQQGQYDTGLRPAVDLPADTTPAHVPGSRREASSSSPQPIILLLKAGLFGIGASVLTAKTLRAGRMDDNRRIFRLRREFSR
jgi:hypothetical protein